MAAQAEYHRLEDYEEDSSPGEEELLVHVTEGLQEERLRLHDALRPLRAGFLFVVTFSTFLLCCVEYDVLFANRPLNHSQVPAPERSKVTLPDAILPAPQCAQRIRANGWVIFLLVMAAVFWLYRLVKVLCSLLSYWEIRAFYIKALNIPSDGLCNYSWQEVQARLISLQREQQMCVHKKELTELDIYHRILRFKNYTVAMVNKSLLPVRFRLPLLGHVVFLTQGLKYNLELLLFWGPGSLFQNKWNLQPQYKRAGSRLELAQRLARTMVLLGLANLLLCPFVLVWQVLYAFFSYTEVIKREPGSLGARRWSLYGRHYLRHFNELNHELQARLSRGYKPATKYMNSFTSPLLTVLAKNVGFFAGSILAVLIVLTVYDEDVLTVQHILTAITLLGLVVTLARSFIPDEHMVWCPEQLLQRVLAHIHYMPDHWQGNASKSETRNEMAQLFQYKAVFILEELLSPILTPLILIFALPARALDIIDFFRNFTVEVVGVGDICSFAQLDIRNHGNPQWLSAGQTEASVYQQAENGKTELSLMHFAITNPRWQPPPQSELFLSHLKEKVQQDAAAAPPAQRILAEGPLGTSLLSDDSATAPDGLLASVLARPILSASGLVSRDRRFIQPCSMASAAASVLASLSSPLPGRARVPSADSPGCHSDRLLPEERCCLRGSEPCGGGRGAGWGAGGCPRPVPALYLCSARSLLLSESRLLSLSRSAVLAEVASAEMSLHAIYMHELHQQQQQGPAPLAVGLWVAAGAPKQPSVTAGECHVLAPVPVGPSRGCLGDSPSPTLWGPWGTACPDPALRQARPPAPRRLSSGSSGRCRWEAGLRRRRRRRRKRSRRRASCPLRRARPPPARGSCWRGRPGPGRRGAARRRLLQPGARPWGPPRGCASVPVPGPRRGAGALPGAAGPTRCYIYTGGTAHPGLLPSPLPTRAGAPPPLWPSLG
ncbi:Autophagy-related protein 9B [Aix galericulata]|nr:Autophagy-related protein 9B [Aix galericulata]